MLGKKIHDIDCSTVEGRQIQERLKIEFFKRFQNIEKNNVLAKFTIMDLHFKRMHFESALNAVNAVSQIQDNVKKNSNKPVPEAPVNSETKDTNRLWGDHDMEVNS